MPLGKHSAMFPLRVDVIELSGSSFSVSVFLQQCQSVGERTATVLRFNSYREVQQLNATVMDKEAKILTKYRTLNQIQNIEESCLNKIVSFAKDEM